MPPRRRSTLRAPQAAANDVPKSIELEQRVSRIELSLRDVQDAVTTLHQRVATIQAHLDHLAAKTRY